MVHRKATGFGGSGGVSLSHIKVRVWASALRSIQRFIRWLKKGFRVSCNISWWRMIWGDPDI